MGQAVTRRLRARARAAASSAMDRSVPDPLPRSAPRTPAMQPAGSAGRKTKGKAPLPPAETKGTDVSSAEDPVESTAVVTEQQDNMIDKDIELSVVLPGDILKSTTVHGSKPMMDLLVFLCAQYHLNPSSHTIDLLSAEENLIKFKPNTPIGMLDVEKVILKPKSLDKKKPTPIIPEKTVRVVINFKKTQKTIVRVSPHAPLQDLAPIICSKCEFDPLHTVLLKDYQAQEPLDLTKSLNDLGLRELYAMDISRAPSATAFSKSSFQESCQISHNPDIVKEKENKGIFSFFQRSKKKREQTASAPATPLVSKHRPSFTRSNTISKPYISNTLPSDAPKKRRAPLPPMPTSQGAAQGQERRASCVERSTSVDDTDKSSSEAIMVRTGSLQLSSTSIGTSSLKRTKRKAPAPPSKTPLAQTDERNSAMAHGLPLEDGIAPDSMLELSSPEGMSTPEGSLGPGFLSQEQCAVPKPPDEISEGPGTPEAAVASLTSGVSSDYSLEEIDEKEELSEASKDPAGSISVKSPDIASASTDMRITVEKDPDSALGISDGETSPSSKGKTQEGRSTEGQGPYHPVVGHIGNEDRVSDSIKDMKTLGPNQESVVQNEIMVCATSTDYVKNRPGKMETTIEGEGEALKKASDMETDRLSGSPACRMDNVKSSRENHLTASPGPDQKLNQPGVEKTKMQDAAIQATPARGTFDGNHEVSNSSDPRADETVQTSDGSISAQHSSASLQDSVNASREFRSQGTSTYVQDRLPEKEPACTYGNNVPLSPVDGSNKNPAASYLKNFPLYRQDSNPKPKPSNEITREYIPKIGMTTYKIVPPKSLEMAKDWESEAMGRKDDQKMLPVGQRHTIENMTETSMQTEVPATSKSSQQPQPDLKPKPSSGTERHLHRTLSSPTGTETNPPKAPRVTTDTGTIPFAPNLEDINNILESKFRSRASNPQAKPSSFFLQMQKRASGHYVTSAAAKSVHTAPGPAPKEPTIKEVQRDPQLSPEQHPSSLSERTHSAPLPNISKADDDIIQKPAETSPPPVAPKPMTLRAETSPPPVFPKPMTLPAETSPPPVFPKPMTLPAETSLPLVFPKPMTLRAETSPPPVAAKPVALPGSQGTSLNLKTLKTFGAPRPYSSSGPSPFALAVVKRSQSFSKACPESASEGSSALPPAATQDEKTHTVNKPTVGSQHGDGDKQNNPVQNEHSSQVLTPADGPSFTLKRQSSLTFQSSDPEHVRQSLLTAIRSGEAAAKLKRADSFSCWGEKNSETMDVQKLHEVYL
ncbi:cordon-bleu protein-like 1 isoform X4 [Mus musculus]|uniref:cordon-bleu protein-like 1 isoform X4 n=1 Tax=Mus musculus TaxID=10090 RepID=UPI0005AB95D5|nr:cordon-bleu protein-like 1 isoform X4 [Mus musculus]|eukprot:XP_011237900.1 PREDICTED: cordon-bleu protein-like 1 isoform X4 [Mus musculus]